MNLSPALIDRPVDEQTQLDPACDERSLDRPLPSVDMFGITLHAVRLTEAVAQLHTWMRGSAGQLRYVVTPNVDHLVMLRQDVDFRATYDDAAMTVADGLPLVLISQLFGAPLPERVAGSDLVPALFAAADPKMGLRVFFLGAAPGVAQRAAENVVKTWPAVSVVGTYSPPLGFEKDIAENNRILHAIAAARPDLLIIGLGAPKQEKWVHKHQHAIDAQVAVCAGATIDFLAGHKQRAPRWIQKSGFEWCYRMLSEPRRLLRRYAIDAWVLPQIVWDEWHKRRHAK